MNVFTEVYDKTVQLLLLPLCKGDWKAIEAGAKLLMQPDGPAASHAEALEDLRKLLAKAVKQTGGAAAKAEAATIAVASRTKVDGFQDRAAMIKQLRHFYMVAKKGAQSIWVVDHPKSYGKWTYDEFSGLSKSALTTQLAHRDEVFGAGNRKMMSDALQLARKWSADAEVALAGKSASTLACVERWFQLAGAGADDVESTRSTLLDGFKKITAACNSGKVIFSDRPHLRASGTYNDTYASVNALDVMPIIYIYELFLKTGKRKLGGKIPKLWLCALTVVHELSHKLQATEDIRYDHQGLKPSAAFPPEKAIKNADSWAYFCGDLLGYVPKSAVQGALN
jgi:hypothetical protein